MAAGKKAASREPAAGTAARGKEPGPMSSHAHPVFTVGHSSHTFEALLAMLQRHGVTAVADVRSAPYSRHGPQFNKAALEQGLRARGVAYVFLGRELGGKPRDASSGGGRVRFADLARTARFRDGLERVIEGARVHRIALLCAEKEPLDCHRTLRVARALAGRGVAVAHILADGRLEPHEAAMDRLLREAGLTDPDLFRSREERIEEAVARREHGRA